MTIYKYQRIITGEFPNHSTLTFRQPTITEDKPVELALVDNWYYVYLSATLLVDDQHPEIQFQEAVLTPTLISSIKEASQYIQLIDQRMLDEIRSIYSIDTEQYFTRIGVGKALGIYTFQPGEEEALLQYSVTLESIRAKYRVARQAVGL